MSKEYVTPEIKEVKFVEDNHADEFIKIPVSRYETLLDAETRIDVIADIVRSDFAKYPTDLGKTVLLIAGHTSYVHEQEEKKKEQ